MKFNFELREDKVVALDGETQAGESIFEEGAENTLIITGTYVEDDYRGEGLAEQLTDQVVAYAKEQDKKIQQAGCSYVVSLFDRKADKYEDIKVDKID